jgi:hypothetical protein
MKKGDIPEEDGRAIMNINILIHSNHCVIRKIKPFFARTNKNYSPSPCLISLAPFVYFHGWKGKKFKGGFE